MIIQPRLKQDNTHFDPVLANNTPDQILAAAKSGKAKKIWNVGDSIPIHIQGFFAYDEEIEVNDNYNAIIIGFNHNAEYEGNNTIHFQIDSNANGNKISFCDVRYNTQWGTGGLKFSGDTSTNAGGWEESHLRKNVCAEFFECLPSEWKEVIKPCKKYTDNVGEGSTAFSSITYTEDNIWLLSYSELTGSSKLSGYTYYINPNESTFTKQYEYYMNEETRNAERYRHDDLNTAVKWWTRSPCANGNFYYAAKKGASYYSEYSTRSYGFSPCFAVG